MAKQKPSQVEEKDPAQCEAHGCPCRASVSVEGGRFTCHAHSAVPVDRWQSVTHALRENSWLAEFIDEVRTMESRHQNWRAFAMQFWANADLECQPQPGEGSVSYQNRMRGELMFRAGALSKRPQPRLIQPVKPGGVFSKAAA
jgi:hypothetical protein